MNKFSFRTRGEQGYSLQFSPFFGNELALVTSTNYGLKGYGKLYYLEVLPNGSINPLTTFTWPHDALFDLSWNEEDPHICATASGDGSVHLWNRTQPNQAIKVWKEHEKEVYGVEWSQIRSQPHQLVTASWDGSIKIWDPHAVTSLCTLKGHHNIVYHATWAVHIPLTIASASGDGTLRIWDLKTPENSIINIQSHQGEVLHCDWNKYDQNILASAGTDGVVRGWDIRNTSHCIFELRGHQYAVKRVKFSPHHASILATVSYDFSTRIWDSKMSNKEVEVIVNHTEFVYGIDFNLHVPGQLADCAFDELLTIYTPRYLQSAPPNV